MARKTTHPTQITRREFLKTAAVTGAAGVLVGCGVGSSTPAPSPTPVSSPTPQATAAPASTMGLRRPEMLKMYPDATSKVVHARHAEAWREGKLNPEAIRAMLDAAMMQLTGASSVRDAWGGLFFPDEKIAIKVNAFRYSAIFTHTQLVKAVTDSLSEVGIPDEQIFVYDYLSSELTTAGYTLNDKQTGVQYLGTDSRYQRGYSINGKSVGLSQILLDCHALINMPVLKSHMLSGVTFAMKNHYGSVDNPESLHSPMNENLAALNALPDIKDRTRLVVGDILEACLRHVSITPYWKSDYIGNSILVSHDPVAADTVALNVFSDLLTGADGDPEWNITRASGFLEQGALQGVGTNDPAKMELIEIDL